MNDKKFISLETDDPLLAVLDAVRSDFADATNPATVRDVSHAFEIIAMQQEALVSLVEVLAGMDLDPDAKQRLARITEILRTASEEFHKNLNYVYDTHTSAQRGE